MKNKLKTYKTKNKTSLTQPFEGIRMVVISFQNIAKKKRWQRNNGMNYTCDQIK